MSYHEELAAHYRDVRERVWPTPLRTKKEQPVPAPLTIVEAVGVPLNLLLMPNWRSLVKLVSLREAVSVADIMGNARFPHIVAARHQAIHLVFTHCNLSMMQIGRCFNRDHSSIAAAVRSVERGRGGQVFVVNGSRERYKNKQAASVVIRKLRTPSTAEYASVDVTAGRQASTPSPTVTNVSTSAGAHGDA